MASVLEDELESLLESGGMHSKTYDVTNSCARAFCCCCNVSQVIHLEPEEAVLISVFPAGRSEKRLPYGELGSVEKVTCCSIFHSFNSNLSNENEHGHKTPISPGFGCSGILVDQIVRDLKERMKGRGDTGNIQRAEESVRLIQFMNKKLKMIVAHIDATLPTNLTPDNAKEHEHIVFPKKDYEVTNCCQRSCCCVEQLLHLEPEEVVILVTSPCVKDVKRFPYGQLQDVQNVSACCFRNVRSPVLGTLSPGWGCNSILTEEIARELKARMRARGDTGNIQRQEFAVRLARDHDRMLNAVMLNLRIPVPDAPPELHQPEMERMCGVGTNAGRATWRGSSSTPVQSLQIEQDLPDKWL